jgi:hypothetical protein
MATERTDLDDGRVLVEVRSRRGTTDHDEDEVTVRAVFDDVDEAEAAADRLTALARERLREARRADVTGAVSDAGAVGDAGAVSDDGAMGDGDAGESQGARTGRDVGEDRAAGDDHVSKVYLGEGAEPSGWVPLPEAVVREQLVPLVRRFAVEEGDTDTIAVNVSDDVTESGWTDVDAGVVTRKMVPIVEDERLDG